MIRTVKLLAAALCLVPAIASAQAPKAATKEAPKAAASAPAPVGTAPERTTASFGDWVLRCETIAGAKRVCEVAQTMSAQGQTNPVAQVAIGRRGPNEGKQLTVVLPTNVAIVTHPQLFTAKTDAAPLDLAWQRCAPGGCFASAPVTDEVVNGLAAQTEQGRIAFKDAADRDATVPLSFRGLSQALAALAKEP